MAEFIKSSRGGTLLVYEDYYFRRRHTKGKIKYWRCTVNQCNATMVTDNEDFIKRTMFIRMERNRKKLTERNLQRI